MANNRPDLGILREFLSMPHVGEAVLKKFAALPGAIGNSGGDMEGFVYVPGTREDGVLLVAHADTVGHEYDGIKLVETPDTIRNARGILGADDRAGCAMLWLLRDLGHGLLLTDGEEYGGIGAEFLRWCCPDIFDEINRRYRFMIEIDRRGGGDFKCYNVGTEEFRAYVGQKTAFTEPDRLRSTDIVYLCRDICGVNLSCGYYGEHTEAEYLKKSEWLHTLRLLKSWLSETDIPEFPLFGAG